MLYALICEDKPDSESLRKATRDDHLAYIAKHEVRLAGPMLNDGGDVMIGSIILLEADTLADAHAFAEADPYKRAGLFAQVTVRPFRQVIPKP